MIGSEAFAPLSVSYNILKLILNKEIPVETHITLNWIDVKDVAEGCYLAATKGKNGERYILANEKCTSIKKTTQIAQQLFPELKIKLPIAVPKPILLFMAWMMELVSKFTGKAPLLSVKDVAMFSGLQQNFDISKAKKELGFNPKFSQEAVKNAFHYLTQKRNLLTKSIMVLMMSLLSLSVTYAQNIEKSSKIYLSVETDPAFWIGTLPNGIGFDANINMRLAKFPRLRWGILGYSGKWSGNFGKTILLTDDFEGNEWETQWNGLGIEAQYQFRFGLKRGGLQPGLRMQWNQFLYNQANQYKGEANHFVLTPQVGFQWFPFKKLGLYILPWAGVQMPILGTNKIVINQEEKSTRKLMPVITAHIGWEFQF
jgi:dihydroflavonol-4-reductase